MLQQLAPHLYAACAQQQLSPGFYFPIRMTVVKLSRGGLALISPVPLDESLAAELQALGPVQHLIAPNLLHHLHLESAQARYPDARVWGPQGIERKAPTVRFDGTLDAPLPAELETDLDALLLHGAPWIGECALLHRSSGTLILTDLVFNVAPHNTRGWLSPWIFRSVGVWQELATSRLLRRRVTDRAAFSQAVRTLLSWPFERLVVAHGDIVDEDAKRALTGSLRWALPAADPPLEPASRAARERPAHLDSPDGRAP